MDAVSSINETDREGETGLGVAQVAERDIKLHGWTRKRRVILCRNFIKKENPEESDTLFDVCQYDST
jgi:hypothetical protein